MDWNHLLNLKTHCFGVIVFKKNSCVIVVPYKNETNIGFPKGKCEKNENIFQCAFRELQEETGLIENVLEFANFHCLHEISKKGNISVSYLVGRFIDDYKPTFTCVNPKEISFCGFENVDALLKMTLPKNAYGIVNDSNTTFTKGSYLLNEYNNNKI